MTMVQNPLMIPNSGETTAASLQSTRLLSIIYRSSSRRCTFDEDAEGVVLHAVEAHQQLVIRGEDHQVPVFIWERRRGGTELSINWQLSIKRQAPAEEPRRRKSSFVLVRKMRSSHRIIDLVSLACSHAFISSGVNRCCWSFRSSDDRQSTRCTGPPLTSVEEAEAPQVAENCGGFAAQEVEAARDVLLHSEAAELADGLVATQQRGLDGHRHPQSVRQSVSPAEAPTVQQWRVFVESL